MIDRNFYLDMKYVVWVYYFLYRLIDCICLHYYLRFHIYYWNQKFRKHELISHFSKVDFQFFKHWWRFARFVEKCFIHFFILIRAMIIRAGLFRAKNKIKLAYMSSCASDVFSQVISLAKWLNVPSHEVGQVTGWKQWLLWWTYAMQNSEIGRAVSLHEGVWRSDTYNRLDHQYLKIFWWDMCIFKWVNFHCRSRILSDKSNKWIQGRF